MIFDMSHAASEHQMSHMINCITCSQNKLSVCNMYNT